MTAGVRTVERLGSTFRAFQGAALGSDLADGVYKLTLPILALSISNSVAAVTAVAVAIRAPWIVITLPAGVLVDRCQPLWLMRTASLVRMPVTALLCVLALTGTLSTWELVAAALVIGSCGTIVDLGAQSLAPSLVSAEQIPRANANLLTGQTLMGQFAGPALAGLLATPIAAGLGVAAACYTISLGLLWFLAARLRAAGQFTGRALVSDRPRRPVLAETREGLRHFVRRRDLVGLAAVAATGNLGFAATMTILPVWVAHDLRQSSTVLGLIVAAPAVGALVIGPLAARTLKRFGAATVLAVSAPLVGLCLLTVAIPVPATAIVAMAGYGGLIVLLNVMTVSHRQSTIPQSLFGRVNSVYRWIILGVSPVGAALGGLLATAFGDVSAFLVTGSAVLLTGLVLPRLLFTPANERTS